jgi:hypothetical protein
VTSQPVLGDLRRRPVIRPGLGHVGRAFHPNAEGYHLDFEPRPRPFLNLVDGDRQDHVGHDVDRKGGLCRPVDAPSTADRLHKFALADLPPHVLG